MTIFRRSSRHDAKEHDQFVVSFSDRRPQWMRDQMQVWFSEGSADLEVVGESRYQDNLWRIVGEERRDGDRVREDVYAVLVPEIDNPYDSYAVSVWVKGLRVGYLSREDARRYRPGVIELQRRVGMPVGLIGVIAGGGVRDDGLGRLGVFLRHDPEDFGVERRPGSSVGARMRTGLSNALATDDADDTYNLSWMAELPTDDIGAIARLRQLLVTDPDPLDRHFMYAQLEALLYRAQKAFASALDEYDETCRRHDEEMDGIRQAFMDKWGKVPVLATYRQMAIRQQKAGSYEQALWWAERGIAVYGDSAARPEAVEDLRRRAERYRAKISGNARPADDRPPEQLEE